MARAQLLEATASFAARLPERGGLQLESDDSITSLFSQLAQVRRMVDAVGAELAAEMERRSTESETSLARKLGERSPAVAVARLTGIDPAEAQDWCSAGAATTTRVSITGELLPHKYEAVAIDLAQAVITPRAVRTIVEALDAVSKRGSATEVARVERVLLDYAPHLTPRELSKLCRQVINQFDHEGIEPRENELRARSGLTVIRGRDGLITWIVKMHPEAAGFLTTAVDARTAPRRMADGVDDDRALPQKRLDALVAIARESLGHDHGRLAGTAVTMNVTMTLDALLSGIGAEIGRAHV